MKIADRSRRQRMALFFAVYIGPLVASVIGDRLHPDVETGAGDDPVEQARKEYTERKFDRREFERRLDLHLDRGPAGGRSGGPS